MRTIWRSSSFSLKAGVPIRFCSVEPREQIWKSLKTDSQKVAEQKAIIVWKEMLSAWEAKLVGSTFKAKRHFWIAENVAEYRGQGWQLWYLEHNNAIGELRKLSDKL